MENHNSASLFFRSALLPSGWAQDVRLTVRDGRIGAIEAGAAPMPRDEIHALALPGMPNLHSHCFQRAMAGLAEHRTGATDSFWSWRALMYHFAAALTPDDIEVIATQAFVEMLETGFCAAAEFHYLHHAPDGAPYADIAETASRIAAAAAATGISLLLLPVFYAHSNFGGLPPGGAQARFVNSLDSYAELVAGCRDLGPTGIAPHSLRAVTPGELQALAGLAGDGPVHIHIAEQMREVRDCIAWCGAPPVAFLLDNAPVAENWCLVHATHASAAERAGIARAGATVGLCPMTEANLGDGIFDARHFAELGGRYGIGSDSNVLISVAQELRQLEYSQRLMHQQRNVIASATALYQQGVSGGGFAFGAVSGLQAGAAANIVTLASPVSGDAALARHVFASRDNLVDCVWAEGRKCVSAGRHRLHETAQAGLQRVVAKLL